MGKFADNWRKMDQSATGTETKRHRGNTLGSKTQFMFSHNRKKHTPLFSGCGGVFVTRPPVFAAAFTLVP